MTDDNINLPPLPRVQVPLIEADVSLFDIRVLARWCERVATDHARAAVLADRQARGEPVAIETLQLLKDARHRIANLSRAEFPFRDPLDGPVLRRLDAAIAKHQRQAGKPVAWHSKLYGTVWMAIKPGSLVPGTQWFIEGRTEPVAEVISPDSLVWRIPAGDLPHGTVFYSAPQPAEPVTHNDCDLSGQFERSDIENHRLRRAMQKIMARLTELLDEDQFATIEGIATDAGVEPPAEPVKVNAIFETQDDEVIGTTDAKVKRVEWQDDGSLTVVIDYWPQPTESEDSK